MIKEFSLNEDNAILNFTKSYCTTGDQLLNSNGFKIVLRSYIKKQKQLQSALYDRISNIVNGDLTDYFLELFKLLNIMDKSSVSQLNNKFSLLLEDNSDLFDFIEGLYAYWRTLERYGILESPQGLNGLQQASFIDATNQFSNLVLKTYRNVEEHVLGITHSVYRQLNAGVQVGLILNSPSFILPKEYKKLKNISIIEQVILTPPFFVYPKQNKRSGFFEETFVNPIQSKTINPSHYYCFPIKIGSSLTLVYFHREYMHHGVALANLFEMAKPYEFENKTPDLIVLFGARNESNSKETVYYKDDINKLYFGYVSNNGEIDYFGYMKKMLLTIHNLRMIDMGKLPIHGAMVSIILKNGISKNIAIVGDSGAGKSESLEAFRLISEEYLKEIKIIFDDMGTFEIREDGVYGLGTEIGAFIRLDDLDTSYAFSQIDRAIYMNTDKQNARVLLPVTTYKTITKGYKVDMLLYANNYEEKDKVLLLYPNKKEALPVFKKALRKAKGTTSETGLVSSYFANPFGPHQRQKDVDKLLNVFYDRMFNDHIDIGEIHTKLAIKGFEQSGPMDAAKELFSWIIKHK